MTNTNSKSVSNNYDATNEIAHLEWITTPASFELKESLNQCLDQVNPNKTTKWIGDVSNNGAIDPLDQVWINTIGFHLLLAQK